MFVLRTVYVTYELLAFLCLQGTVESDDVGFDLVSGSTDLASSNGNLVFVKYIQPNSTAYGKLRYLTVVLQLLVIKCRSLLTECNFLV